MAVKALEFLLFSYFGNSENAIDAAIKVAYRDMAAHTLTKKVNDNREDLDDWQNRKEEAKKAGCKSIVEALDSLGQRDYDEWHKELCKTLNSVYNEHNAKLTFGQAQKWVNMTMKYLYMFYLLESSQIMQEVNVNLRGKYTLKDKNLYQNIQKTNENYHIPLDNYILKRLFELKKAEKLKTDIEFKCCYGDSYRMQIGDKYYPWSKIPFDSEKDTVCERYYKLQNDLRNDTDVKLSGTLIRWEFDNWLQAAMEK